MFWTIVGALAFFFIGLPIIMSIMTQKWFWWMIGMGLLLLAVAYMRECEKDQKAQDFKDWQENRVIEDQQRQQQKVLEEKRQQQQVAMEHQQMLKKRATQAELKARDAAKHRSMALKQNEDRRHIELTQIESLRDTNAQLIANALGIYQRGDYSFRLYLKSMTRFEIIQLQESMLAEERYFLSKCYSIGDIPEITKARRMIDAEAVQR
jgi:hypothetical protein